ncbi:MAG: histidinol-phosphate aminotransferase [Cryptosporangiaceae bacterium]|nr:histidinol-phosphate aminotransferase [Cryptosporangiaceae bacterium]
MTELVVGIGARRGVTADELAHLLDTALTGLDGTVRALATVAGKDGEAAIVAIAAARGWPIVSYPAEELATVAVPNPSAAALGALGTPSVAEAAALYGGRAELIVPKLTSPMAAVAVARHPSHDLRHHGDREATAGLVDLAVNVRAAPRPTWLTARVREALGELESYPDGRVAREAIAARHGRDPGEVLLTAGAAEAFVLLARVLDPRRAVVVHPQFTEPEAALRAAGHKVERVVLRERDGFQLDRALIPATADLVMIGNPTNPTSVLHPSARVAELARAGRTLVVDEAFADTVPGESGSLSSRRDVPGLVVVRSLTKTWGLAGLRIGYVLADPRLIAELAEAQPLWPVSAPALAAAEACASPLAVATADEFAIALADDREHLLKRLGTLDGVTVAGLPSSSFVLVKVPDGRTVRDRLRASGYAVRRGDTFPGLGPDWLRVAVRDRDTSTAFTAALARALAPAAGITSDDDDQPKGSR